MVRCLQAVQKLVLVELCAADRVPPLVHAPHRGRSHRLPVQQGSGGAADGHISASARDRHGMVGSQVVVEAEQFVVLQKTQRTHIMSKTYSTYSPGLTVNVVLILMKASGPEREIYSLLLHDCVLFGSDNTSGYRPIDQQLVWQVALVRNVCLFGKWSSST